jgi:hypothetical protein
VNKRTDTNFMMWARTLFVAVVFSVVANAACAQGSPGWFGSTSWFDWSDFRTNVSARVFIARLESGSFRTNAGEVDLKNAFGFSNDPEPFRELLGELYIDRLGFRFAIEDTRRFSGLNDDNPNRLSVLDVGSNRVGVDVDLIRFPSFRMGVDADYQANFPKLWDRRSSSTDLFAQYSGSNPITAGLHCRALPGRIRQIPVTLEGRIRFPVSLNQDKQARVTEIELSGGLRPSVWSTSVLGHSTFAVAVELGFRLTDLNMTMSNASVYEGGSTLGLSDVTLKARWSGAFLQVALFY